MARWQNLKWIAVGSLAVVASAGRAEEATPLPKEVREIQQSLGGPVVDQFPSLRPAESAWPQPAPNQAPQPTRTPPSGMWPNWSSAPVTRVTPAMAVAPDERLRVQVGSLRETAAQLDGSANRLETLELYQQADALRTVAQRLRMEARSMRTSAAPSWGSPTEAPQVFERSVDPRQRREEGRAAQPRRLRSRREAPAETTAEPTPADPAAENGG